MHHAMTDRHNLGKRLDHPAVGRHQFAQHTPNCLGMIGNIAGFHRFFAIGRLVGQDRILQTDPLDQADRHTTLV